MYTVIIPFKKPLQKREEIRLVLEAMAKEAEEALGLVKKKREKYNKVFFYLKLHYFIHTA